MELGVEEVQRAGVEAGSTGHLDSEGHGRVRRDGATVGVGPDRGVRGRQARQVFVRPDAVRVRGLGGESGATEAF